MDISLIQPLAYAFFDPITLAVGLGVSAFGMFSSNKAAKEQEAAQAAYAAQQNAISAAQAGISAKISKESIAQEKLRKQQMRQDYRNNVLNVVRQAQLRQAMAESNAAAQGATFSSTMQGATAAITSDAANQRTNLYESFQRGLDMFRSQRRILGFQNQIAQLGTQANMTQADFQTTSMQNQNAINFGNTLFSTGMNIAQNAPQINNALQGIAGYVTGPMGTSNTGIKV